MSLHAAPDPALRRSHLRSALDRIDIHIDVPAVRFKDLAGQTPPDTDSSANIRERVVRARERQQERFKADHIFSNAAMTPRMIRRSCKIDDESEQMLSVQ